MSQEPAVIEVLIDVQESPLLMLLNRPPASLVGMANRVVGWEGATKIRLNSPPGGPRAVQVCAFASVPIPSKTNRDIQIWVRRFILESFRRVVTIRLVTDSASR